MLYSERYKPPFQDLVLRKGHQQQTDTSDMDNQALRCATSLVASCTQAASWIPLVWLLIELGLIPGQRRRPGSGPWMRGRTGSSFVSAPDRCALGR